jgi:hypothetical protein
MSDDITRVSSEELDEFDDRTDWERVEKMSDEDIEEEVAEDEDQELLPAEWFQAATLSARQQARSELPFAWTKTSSTSSKARARGITPASIRCFVLTC